MDLSRRELLTRSGQVAAVATAAGAINVGTAHAEPDVAASGGHGTSVKLTQGTNISVSRSRDGKWLAIDLVVSIWVLPVTGGVARRLTDELQDATLPSWGPDGQIAFQSYRDGNFHLYLADSQGSIRQLTSGKFDHREPAFSPDGSKLAFVSDRTGAYALHLLDLKTNAITAITTPPDDLATPQWSADGKRIIVNVGVTAVDAVTLDGTRERLVTAPAGAQLFGAAFGPGGQPSYTLMRPGQADLMLGTTAVTTKEDVFGFAPVWDGDSVLYTADGKIRVRTGASVRDIPFEATVPVKQVKCHRGGQNLLPGLVKGIASPVVSPDGSTIAFRALNALYLLRNGKTTKLTDGTYFDSDPDFSPDGTKLVYASDRDGTAQLRLRDLKSGEDKAFAPGPGAQTSPRFSPDGTKVAYVDQDGSVWIADPAGRRQVTPTLFQPGRPTWSKDGTVVALAAVKPFSRRFREGTSQILTVDLVSGELKYTEPMPFRSIATRGDDGPVWSPDGKHLAFVVESLAYVVAVDAKGNPTGPPRQVTREVTDSLAWHGNNALVYLNNGTLKKSTLDGKTSVIRHDLTWRKPKAPARTVVHVGAYWDGEAEKLRANVDIIVENGRIAAIRPHSGKADVDASSLTAIPGLIDAHNHWHLRGKQWGARQGRLWLSYGITTVRSPGDPVYQMQETREALAAGTLVGPRFYATGEAIDGGRVYYNFMRPTLSRAQLDLELRRAHELGYDMIKTYVRLPVELQRAAVQRARVPLSSHYHYPAALFGMDGQEHVGATNRLGYSHTISRQGKAYQDVLTIFTASGMSMTPTLFHSKALYDKDKSLVTDERSRVLFPPWEYERYVTDANNAGTPAAVYSRDILRGWVEFALKVHRGGGLVLCGTDAPLDTVATATHQNLRAMVEYGFTPREALITATRNPALWLGRPIGSLKPGALADITFVEGNPLEDIKAAANVKRVMVGGHVHKIADLLKPYQKQQAFTAQPVAALEPLPSAENHHWWHQPEWSEHVCCDH